MQLGLFFATSEPNCQSYIDINLCIGVGIVSMAGGMDGIVASIAFTVTVDDRARKR